MQGVLWVAIEQLGAVAAGAPPDVPTSIDNLDSRVWTIHGVLHHSDEAWLEADFVAALFPIRTILLNLGYCLLTSVTHAGAVRRETLRRFPFVPHSIARRLDSDLKLPSDGSTVPAGTVVIAPNSPANLDSHVLLALFVSAQWLPPATSGGRIQPSHHPRNENPSGGPPSDNPRGFRVRGWWHSS